MSDSRGMVVSRGHVKDSDGLFRGEGMRGNDERVLTWSSSTVMSRSEIRKKERDRMRDMSDKGEIKMRLAIGFKGRDQPYLWDRRPGDHTAPCNSLAL